jgi:5-methylcytosine-specific restriction endonuclease McrA
MTDKAYRDAHKEEIKAYNAIYHPAHYAVHKEEVNAKTAAYYQTHREQVADTSAAYHQAHKAEHGANCAAYYRAHKEELLAYRKTWREAHKERKAAQDAEWRRTHPERIAAYQVTRRARKAGSPTIGKVDRGQVFERDRGICHICKLVVDPKHWHMDHIVPLSKGGAHVMANVAVSHQRCNDSKGAKLVW